MRKMLIVGASAVVAVSTSVAVASDVADIPWTKSNLEALRGFDSAAIVRFMNDLPESGYAIKPDEILEFQWSDLEGDGRYALLTRTTFGPCCTYLGIFRQEASGRITQESHEGVGDLSGAIRDLDGDGKEELILSTYLDSDSYRGADPTPTYPAVYRLKNRKYVEASRDFPAYYDNERLPQFAQEIQALRASMGDTASADGSKYAQRRLAALEMGRDKILRVLGRERSAGLEKAREWMESSDRVLTENAVVVLRDIGGHEDDLRVAEVAARRAAESR